MNSAVDEVPKDVLQRIGDSIIEMQRLRGLSNEDLVSEYLKLTEEQDDELHTNEMCTRLWPGWEDREL